MTKEKIIPNQKNTVKINDKNNIININEATAIETIYLYSCKKNTPLKKCFIV